MTNYYFKAKPKTSHFLAKSTIYGEHIPRMRRLTTWRGMYITTKNWEKVTCKSCLGMKANIEKGKHDD